MKDEISKRFDEQFDDFPFHKRHKAFLNSELERLEKEIKWKEKVADEWCDKYYKLEKRFKKQQKINNEVLGDKCDEMERLLKEQEKRLRLSEDEVLKIINPYAKYNVHPRLSKIDKLKAKEICQLQENTKKA